MSTSLTSTSPQMLRWRFFLEIAALAGYFFAGWNMWGGAMSLVGAIVLPAFAGVVWSAFAVADDPTRQTRAPFPVSGRTRLAIELIILGGAFFAFLNAGLNFLGLLYAIALGAYFYFARDRFTWLQSVDKNGRPIED
ncbi:YrdB family protein [Salininema proteolyticum]|uniref:YrdB family protein n=1 Tax=Salininema proteolyticum TaxID=1607685 RepID=A0ABV8U377_9ACTN